MKQFNKHILRAIKGSCVLVGPALMYGDDNWSVMCVAGEPDRRSTMHKVVLGGVAPEVPEWANCVATVLVVKKPNDLTHDEAKKLRDDLIQWLERPGRTIESFDNDLSLALAYAERFPSPKSKRIRAEVVEEIA